MIYLLAVEFVGDDDTINMIHKFYEATRCSRYVNVLPIENDTFRRKYAYLHFNEKYFFAVKRKKKVCVGIFYAKSMLDFRITSFFIISNGITIWIIQFGIGISNAFKGIHIPIELHSRANVYEIAKRNVKKRIQFKFQMHAQFERQLS